LPSVTSSSQQQGTIAIKVFSYYKAERRQAENCSQLQANFQNVASILV
jgi:hypothetical protein